MGSNAEQPESTEPVVDESVKRYDTTSDLAFMAVAEIREYCNDPRSYCIQHNCGLTVTLRHKHPVAMKVNQWYECLDGSQNLTEDQQEWWNAGKEGLGLDYERVLELWFAFVTRTNEEGEIPFAREHGRHLADYIEELYTPGEPEEPTLDEKSPSGRVKLFGLDQPVEVEDHILPLFNANEYAIVKELLTHPEGRTNKQIFDATKYRDPRKLLDRLRGDELWRRVISKVKVSGTTTNLWICK